MHKRGVEKSTLLYLILILIFLALAAYILVRIAGRIFG